MRWFNYLPAIVWFVSIVAIMSHQDTLIASIALIATIALIALIALITPGSQACHDSYLVAPYYDLTAPGPQGSPYALETCMP